MGVGSLYTGSELGSWERRRRMDEILWIGLRNS